MITVGVGGGDDFVAKSSVLTRAATLFQSQTCKESESLQGQDFSPASSRISVKPVNIH